MSIPTYTPTPAGESNHKNNKPNTVARATEKILEIDDTAGSASLLKAVVVKTSSNPISELLKQFVSLTSGTSSGSANVMSTQLNSAAPWTAVSITCMVALSPTLTEAFAGNGT